MNHILQLVIFSVENIYKPDGGESSDESVSSDVNEDDLNYDDEEVYGDENEEIEVGKLNLIGLVCH